MSQRFCFASMHGILVSASLPSIWVWGLEEASISLIIDQQYIYIMSSLLNWSQCQLSVHSEVLVLAFAYAYGRYID